MLTAALERAMQSTAARFSRARKALALVLMSTAVAAAAQAGQVQAASAASTSTPTPTEKGTLPTPFVDGTAGSYAWGVATMPDGTVIVGDIWNRRVLHYDTSGNLVGPNNGVLFTEPTQGDAPYGLAVDPNPANATVYVGRQFPQGVEIYTQSAGVYSYAGLLHVTGMQYPSRVTTAADGTVYIADMLANKIFVFSGATAAKPWQYLGYFGSRGKNTGQFIQPRGLAFDNSSPQHLYVVDSYNYRVQVFTVAPAPTFLTYSFQFGKAQFTGDTNTRGLAIDTVNKWVFVVDIQNRVVDKFDLSGNFIGTIGGSSNGTFPAPVGQFVAGGREATIDGAGQLWVGDMPDFRVQVFKDSDGTPLFQRPDPLVLPADGAFNDPRGLTVDSQGNLYVADTHNFRLEKFDPSGNWVWSVGNRGRSPFGDDFNYSRNMAADPGAPVPCAPPVTGMCTYVYLADTYNYAIDKYDSNGNLVWKDQGSGSGPGQFAYPSGVGVGPDLQDSINNALFVADSRNKRIQVLDPSTGAEKWLFSCSPCADPRGVAVDPATGYIYVADMNAGLYEFSNSGSLIATLATKGTGPGQLSTASDVTLDSNFIYVADSGLPAVDIFSLATGQYVTSFGTSGKTKLHLPSAVAVNPVSGHLFVAEEYADRVSEWCLNAC